MRSDRKRAMRIIHFCIKDIKYKNEIIMQEIIKRRLELSGKDSNNEGTYAEILYNRSADYRETNRILRESEKRLEFLQQDGASRPLRSISISKNIVREYKNNYYNLDVSPHNLPIANMIGDIQISDDKKVIFHTDNIDCSIDSCVVKCILNEPSINRLLDRSPYKVDPEIIHKMTTFGEKWIMYKQRVAGHVTISFGNVELKELVVEKPHCSVEIVMNYACLSCLELPKVVIASKGLVREGALTYESNCTWDHDLLSCNSQMYEIKQLYIHPICRIHIPILNQTIDINFNFEYRGTLTIMKSIRAETTLDVISTIGSDPYFYTTLLGSLSSFLLLTTITTVIIKLTKLGIIACGKKEISNA
ncbi:unnamed protein product [Parnassius mnemosyne]|uniref:Envelope protein n=1 Tax=Parnassius mnemosyne TaxID=213953 RepID=A0AAV1KWE3_9NEOP